MCVSRDVHIVDRFLVEVWPLVHNVQSCKEYQFFFWFDAWAVWCRGVECGFVVDGMLWKIWVFRQARWFQGLDIARARFVASHTNWRGASFFLSYLEGSRRYSDLQCRKTHHSANLQTWFLSRPSYIRKPLHIELFHLAYRHAPECKLQQLCLPPLQWTFSCFARSSASLTFTFNRPRSLCPCRTVVQCGSFWKMDLPVCVNQLFNYWNFFGQFCSWAFDTKVEPWPFCPFGLHGVVGVRSYTFARLLWMLFVRVPWLDSAREKTKTCPWGLCKHTRGQWKPGGMQEIEERDVS